MSEQAPGQSGTKHINTILVFCGSQYGKDPGIVKEAETLGKLIAQRGYSLIYGGGVHGLMGTVSRAALTSGAWVKGIIPKVFHSAGSSSQGSLEGSEEHIVENMMLRKEAMIQTSDAAIALPGGDGTIDEIAEMVVAQQIKTYGSPDQPVQPIIVINYNGYYDDYIRQRQKAVDYGFLSPAHQKLLTFVNSAQEAMDVLDRLNAKAPVPARAFTANLKLG